MTELNTFYYFNDKIFKVMSESKSLYYITGYECLIDKTIQLEDKKTKTYYLPDVDLTSKTRLYYVRHLKCVRFKTIKNMYILNDGTTSTLIDEYNSLTPTICECPVCYNEKETFEGFYSCSHSFCRGCFDKWTNKNKSCPLCRSE